MISSRPDLAAVLAFASAAVLTALIVPLVRQLGLRWGLIDQPDPRKQHTTPMVRLGGIGIVAGFVLGLSAAAIMLTLRLLRISREQIMAAPAAARARTTAMHSSPLAGETISRGRLW